MKSKNIEHKFGVGHLVFEMPVKDLRGHVAENSGEKSQGWRYAFVRH